MGRLHPDIDLNEVYGRIRQGENSQRELLFEALRSRFGLFVHRRVGNSEDAEEIVQTALTVIHAEISGLDIRASFAAWAYSVLKNRLLAFYEQRGREHARTVPISAVSGENEPVARGSDPELKRRLLDCLARIGRLNRRYARMLNLRAQGYGADELCAMLGVEKNNMYSILHRARGQLARCLETGEVR